MGQRQRQILPHASDFARLNSHNPFHRNTTYPFKPAENHNLRSRNQHPPPRTIPPNTSTDPPHTRYNGPPIPLHPRHAHVVPTHTPPPPPPLLRHPEPIPTRLNLSSPPSLPPTTNPRPPRLAPPVPPKQKIHVPLLGIPIHHKVDEIEPLPTLRLGLRAGHRIAISTSAAAAARTGVGDGGEGEAPSAAEADLLHGRRELAQDDEGGAEIAVLGFRSAVLVHGRGGAVARCWGGWGGKARYEIVNFTYCIIIGSHECLSVLIQWFQSCLLMMILKATFIVQITNASKGFPNVRQSSTESDPSINL